MPEFHVETPLQPLGVYLVVMHVMFGLGLQQWSGSVDLSRLTITTSPESHVMLSIFSDSPELQPGHIIIALYNTVSTMYAQRPGFDKLNCGIFLRKRRIGLFYMTPTSPRPVLSGSQDDTVYEWDGIEGVVSVVNNTSILKANSGVVIDPADTRFRISWSSDGNFIPVQEMLSSIIDGMATTAQYDYDGPCSYITGVSFSGNVAFHINGCSGQTLLCRRISKAYILLVALVIVKERQFREMEMTLYFDGETIGEGYVLKISSVEGHGSNGTGRTATS